MWRASTQPVTDVESGEFNGSLGFDAEWYADQYPDVVALGMDPAEHYIRFGAKLGRSPSAAAHANRSVHPVSRPGGRVADRAGDSSSPAEWSEKGRLLSRVPPNIVTEGLPHYGETLEAIVGARRALQKAEGTSEEYDLIRQNFDLVFYLVRYRDILSATNVDPIQHYINAGAREGRDPSPNFSTKLYRSRYPEVHEEGINPYFHWLKFGRAKGYIAEPFSEFEGMCEVLDKSPAEVHATLEEKRQDVRERLQHGVLGEMVAKASEIEPLVAHSWPEALQMKFPPFNADEPVRRLVRLHNLQKEAEFSRADFVFVVNKPRWGGGRRIEGHIAHALASVHGACKIVVIFTDQTGEVQPGRFPPDVRLIDFWHQTDGLKPAAKERLLVEFIRSLVPRAVFNINSRLLWDALEHYGKALTASVSIYACLFCNEQTRLGFWTGYPAKFFYRYFDILAGVVCDSHYLRRELIERFHVPTDQQKHIAVLEAPVEGRQDAVSAPLQTEDMRRKQVFWAGRFDRQKRLDIVYALAKRLPDLDFRLWGEAVMGGDAPLPVKPGNVILEGKYGHFSELPLQECDVWLYTSEWDGVPSLLLEVAMTGVPLVGSRVGGTGEVLLDDFSHPVDVVDDVDAYVTAIQKVLRGPSAARTGALRLKEYLMERRTSESYVAALKNLLSTKSGMSDQ